MSKIAIAERGEAILTVAAGYPDESTWFGNQGTGICASSRRCGHVCVVGGGRWWRTTFDRSDRDVNGVWSSSEAYRETVDPVFSWRVGEWVRTCQWGVPSNVFI